MKVAALALAILGIWLLILAVYARRLLADWREPVLAQPVLIIESDDWGPGPPADAVHLQKLSTALQAFRDCRGNAPVVTLGVVLAVPRGGAPERGSGAATYVPQTLADSQFAALRSAMLAGLDAGVFALQLHAMEHFWPPALLKAAGREATVRAFLNAERGVPRHESLPSHLQARWIDASTLPSRALSQDAIDRAVADEVGCFSRVFGRPPRVAVPVTFTWTTGVEAAWARNGIRVVVTPGTRYIGRDSGGRLTSDGSILRNGQAGASGVVHVVRDVFFEPALGHKAGQALQRIRAQHALGRPALLEMHRFNFTGEATMAGTSFAELERLLQEALGMIPGLRFMSTEKLADALVTRDPALVDSRLAARVCAFIRRAATEPRLRKLAWISALALPAVIAFSVASALQPYRGAAQPSS